MTLAIAPAPCEGRPEAHREAPPEPQRGADRRSGLTPVRGRLVLATTILGSSIAFIDASVVSVALPAIQEDFRASLGEMSWVVNAYVLALASLILIGGSLGDHFGRRRVFIAGMVLFAAASLACALAPTAEALIAARALKGVGGALLVPNSLAILSAAFPRETRGRAIGAWSGFGALTGAGGPVFGGWMVDALDWEAVFLINVPIAALTVLLAILFVPESRGAPKGAGAGEPRAGLDWTGAALAAAGLGGVAYGLVRLSETGSAGAWGAMGAGAALFAGFVAWEARSTQPMVPLGLFRSRTFSGVNLMTAFLYAGLGGALFLVPFQLIGEEGYSAAQAGAAFLPFSISLGLFSGFVGGRLKRLGVRMPLVVGGSTAAAALASMSVFGGGEASYFASWLWPFLGLGLGMTLVVAPLTTAVFNSVPDAMSGVASGVNNAVTRTAQLIAVAAAGALAAAFDFRTAVLGLAALAGLAAPIALFLVRDDEAAPPDGGPSA